MSQYRTRENAIYRADDAVKQLASRNIALPANVAGAVDTLDRVRGTRPAPPAQTAIRDLILAGADQADIDAALLADVGYSRLAGEWSQAALSAAQRVLHAIRDEHDAIFEQLAVLADKQIKHVTAVAAFGGETLENLVRAGRHPDAQLLAEVDVAAAELRELWSIRDQYLSDGADTLRVGGWDCSRWRDERPVDHHAGNFAPGLTEHLLGGLRVGAELWYPSATEAVDAAEQVQREQAAKERAANADRVARGLGGQFA